MLTIGKRVSGDGEFQYTLDVVVCRTSGTIFVRDINSKATYFSWIWIDNKEKIEFVMN